MTTTQVLPELDKEITEPDGFAHYARIDALVKGGPVEALCGKKYVPTTVIIDEDREICPKCKELMAMLEMMYPS